MPTIDELPPAISVGDSDELLISQNGDSLKATRAQILSGVQDSISLAQGSLLGRTSSGIGGPEAITIGANLSLVQGTLTAPSAFSIASLGVVDTIGRTDLVGIEQGGQNAAISYAAFMAAIGELSGINGSALVIDAPGIESGIRLSTFLENVASVAAYGAVGDGVTDDTAAIAAAIANNRVVRFDPLTYLVNGSLNVQTEAAFCGVKGFTVLKRGGSFSSALWIQITGANFFCLGVSFDGGGLATVDTPVIQIGDGCNFSSFSNCQFLRATGSNYGDGVFVNENSGGSHEFYHCSSAGNSLSGFNIQNAKLVKLIECCSSENGAAGVLIQAGIDCVIESGNFSQNIDGISYGNWQENGASGSKLNELTIANNVIESNQRWAIALAGLSGSIRNNIVSNNGSAASGGSILVRGSSLKISENACQNAALGIDVSSTFQCLVIDNQVSSALSGIVGSGAQQLIVKGNIVQSNQNGISLDLLAQNVSQQVAQTITLDGNVIVLSTPTAVGVAVLNGIQGILIRNNEFWGSGGALTSQALWLHTDAAILKGNSWNNSIRTLVTPVQISGNTTIVFDDFMNDVLLGGVSDSIESILTSHQVATIGQIMFGRILSGGSGYTSAVISFSGSGAGAAAEAVVVGGVVVAVYVTNSGSGYGPVGGSVVVTISGDGSGAAAEAFVGLPVLEGRRLRIWCENMTVFETNGSAPQQNNWTGFGLSIPAGGEVTFEGISGVWQAGVSPSVDYLGPTGNGGVVFGSAANGNVYMRPAGDGRLHVGSEDEPTGYVTCVGRGTPEGVITAPPGSDYRNLEGGVGTTLWVKNVGDDSNGWISVA